MAATRRPLVGLLVGGSLLAAVGCSDEPARARATDPDRSGELDPFCEAVRALEDTDGTTEDTIVLAALDALRHTAPEEVHDDVVLLTDTMIVNDYPAGADDTMDASPVEVSAAAGDRLEAFVNGNCSFSADDGS